MNLAEQLELTQREGCAAFAAASDEAAVEAVRIDYLGRQGKMKDLKEVFKAVTPGEKRQLGRQLGAVDQALKDALNDRLAALRQPSDDTAIDVTLPAGAVMTGSMHPISHLGYQIEQVFHGMGYEVIDGPHVETEEFNFTRLNIPDDHPARDAQDTFWLTNGLLLRTHTSSVQSRTFLAEDPPMRKVVVGKVFRYEAVDATHDNTFTQVEGFLVDEDITVAHLVGTLRTLLTGVLGRDDVEIRLRPSFFPFVEPGFEVDVKLSQGEGRFADWVELLGCGMIHPDVLRQGNIDPDRYQGFAFGLGLERLAMIRYGIDDIRLFNGADLRGLQQFGLVG